MAPTPASLLIPFFCSNEDNQNRFIKIIKKKPPPQPTRALLDTKSEKNRKENESYPKSFIDSPTHSQTSTFVLHDENGGETNL